MMAGPDNAMQQEQAFLKALDDTKKFTTEDGALVLMDDSEDQARGAQGRRQRLTGRPPATTGRARPPRGAGPVRVRSSAQKYQGKGDQSGSRFSRNWSRPSTASSVM